MTRSLCHRVVGSSYFIYEIVFCTSFLVCHKGYRLQLCHQQNHDHAGGMQSAHCLQYYTPVSHGVRQKSLPHSAVLRQLLLPPSASVTRRLRSPAAATSPSASRTAHRQSAYCKTVGQRRRNFATAAARLSARTAHLGDCTCLAARATSWSSPKGIQGCLRVSTTIPGSTSRRA